MFDIAIAWLVSRLKAADIQIILTVHDTTDNDEQPRTLWVERIELKRTRPGFGAIVKVEINDPSTTTSVQP